MSKEHILKTDPSVFQMSWEGLKGFEIRLNDRDYTQGDTLVLRETKHAGEDMLLNKAPLAYTGREIKQEVDYVLHGAGNSYGISAGWVVMSVTVIWQDHF